VDLVELRSHLWHLVQELQLPLELGEEVLDLGQRLIDAA
jgi:hypothetical protein